MNGLAVDGIRPAGHRGIHRLCADAAPAYCLPQPGDARSITAVERCPAIGEVVGERIAFSAAVVGLSSVLVRLEEGVEMPRLQGEETTRRRILKLGLAAAGGAVAGGPALAADNDPAAKAAAEQAPEQKFSLEAVHYQPTPKDWEKCLYCMYFQAPDTCGIVSGKVSRQGWCDHFALLHE